MSLRVLFGLCLVVACFVCVSADPRGSAELPTTPAAPTPTPAPRRDVQIGSGEGFPCRQGVITGMCTAGACIGGSKLPGLCGGPANVKCCIVSTVGDRPPSSAPGAASATGAAPPRAIIVPGIAPGASAQASANKSLFPWLAKYSFPYAAGLHLVADFKLQRLRVYRGSVMQKEYKISSGVHGVSTLNNNPASPPGKLRIAMKVGGGQPVGMSFKALRPTGQITVANRTPGAYMTSRILVLEGADPENRNTRARSVYIHGTNKENQLGNMASHGCFRVSNQAAIELFDMIPAGTEFFAMPSNAWPQ